MSQDVCASCGRELSYMSETGVSEIYSPRQEFILCSSCWRREDAMISDAGHNDHPDVLKRYRKTLSEVRQDD